jgi:hypothetical protein
MLDKPGLKSSFEDFRQWPELSETSPFFPSRRIIEDVALRLLSLWRINSIKGATDETITRNHVQESAREKHPTASDDLQALWRSNLFIELFESSPRGSRQKNSLTQPPKKGA